MSCEYSSLPAEEMLAGQQVAAPSEGEQQSSKQERKKRRGFDYVPADSVEADTLKDKFWRDLDQGKIYFDNADDMYTRVKRPSKQLQLNLRSQRCVRRTQSLQIHRTNSDDITPNISLPSSAGLTNTLPALVPASGPVDPFTPSSSGYDSSSIPSVGATTTADSPVDTLPMLSIGRHHDWKKKKRLKNRKLKKHSTKILLSSRSSGHVGQPRVFNVNKRAKGEGKFFSYVSANSAEADTLKDKFWRELDQGLVSVTAATDLYSSVKVSRRSRQLAVASLSTLDPSSSDSVTPSSIPTSSTNESVSPSNEASSNPDLSLFGHSEGCKVMESDHREQTDGNVKCVKDERDAPSMLSVVIGVHKQEHSESELMIPNPDSKLNSPCAVSVKRLQFCDYKCTTDEDNGDSDKHCSKLEQEEEADAFHGENNTFTKDCRLMDSFSKSNSVSSSTDSNVTDACNATTTRDEIGENHKQVTCAVKGMAAVNSNIFYPSLKSSLSVREIERLSSVENVKFVGSRAAATNDTQVDSDSSSGSDTDTSSRPPSTASAAVAVMCKTNTRGLGTLWDAVESGELSYVRHIVLNELSSSPLSQIHVRDNNGTTLLMLATRLGSIAIVRLLMMNGIDINAQNRAGLTALMVACSLGCKEIASTLLGKGALMELRDVYGETALFKAVRACDTDIICMLLGSGVNIGAMVASGRSALNVAVDNHRRDIVDLINRHILRLKVTFKEEIERSLAGIASLGTAVFPLQCFALHECIPSVSVTFKGIPAQIHRGQLGVLFVGHAHVGIHTVRCWLSGSCAVTAVSLNKTPLQPLSAAGNFVTCFEPIVEEQNELVLYISPQSAPTQNEVKLLVSAYFVDWCYLSSPFS